ncbi:MAG TPA: DNA polymerase III subunit gamma/tau [Coriobacteriia bacterium]|nr:DNA polymerase III subunit gamma/tau [Coriobacteriia bacterium]
MAHTSLYRKYRPATFDDVVGQQHIERTLRNAVADGSVAHAYLFTGPRGTGKTTTARLLAKALLCERGPSDEPDGTCEQCIEISESRHPDVSELDAASRTGVDNVREEIIGRVSFAPTRGRYKVYIIDEVHMLSTAAFNALLKTLEEPPEHVVFVLCTTHPNKVPETIQSRCQRFDFRRLSVEDIADRLRFIAEAEGFHVDRNAFTLMARHAEGGMRDAITSLEQLASFTGGEITTDDVEGMLGEVDAAQLFDAAELIARRDVAAAFRWVAAIVETGTDLTELVRELTGHVRDLFVIAAVGDATGVVDRTAEDLARLEAQAAEFGGPDRLARVLDVLGELAAEMRWSSDPRLSVEVALTRMARPRGEMTLEALAERVEALERTGLPAGQLLSPPPAAEAVAGPSAPQPGTPTAKQAEPAATPPAPAAPTPVAAPREPAAAAMRKPGALDRSAVKRDWQSVLLEIKKLKPARVQTFANVEVDIDTDGAGLVIEFPSDQAFSLQLAEESDNRELLKRALTAVFGHAPPFRYQLGRGAVRPLDPPSSPEPVTRAPRVDVAPDAPAPGPDDEPLPEYYESGTGMSEPTAPTHVADTHASPLEQLLVNGLGATIVGEHRPETDGEDKQ